MSRGARRAPRLEALDRALGVCVPRRRRSVRRALTHRSFAFEQGLTVTNERLEFLGDSVLGLVVTDMAYASYPEMPEGQLAKLRAAIVNMQALADVARASGSASVVLLGKGEEHSGGRDKASILADALEASSAPCTSIAGSTCRARADRAAVPPADGGLRPRRGRPRLQDDPAGARLAASCARCPSTESQERGPDHEKEFTATVVSSRARRSGTGIGRSKKEAEQQAAREAYARIARAPRRRAA